MAETASPTGEPPGVRVRTHPGLCVGWGECHRWAPSVYPLDADGRVAVHVMEVPAEHAEDAWWGATACPERAITVIGPPEQYWYDRLRHRHGERGSINSKPPEEGRAPCSTAGSVEVISSSPRSDSEPGRS